MTCSAKLKRNAELRNYERVPKEGGLLKYERSCCLLLVKFLSSKLQAPRADWAGALARVGGVGSPSALAAARGLGAHVAFRDASVERPTSEPPVMFLDLTATKD